MVFLSFFSCKTKHSIQMPSVNVECFLYFENSFYKDFNFVKKFYLLKNGVENLANESRWKQFVLCNQSYIMFSHRSLQKEILSAIHIILGCLLSLKFMFIYSKVLLFKYFKIFFNWIIKILEILYPGWYWWDNDNSRQYILNTCLAPGTLLSGASWCLT